MHRCPYLDAVVLFLCLTVCTRCDHRQPQSAGLDKAMLCANATGTSSEAGSANAVTAVPSDPGPSAEEIEQTIDAIHKAGGTVTRDADGSITGVDLTRKRTPVDDKLAQAVLRLPRLRMLRLAVDAISPETLSRLGSHRQLTELALRDAPLTDAQLVRLLESLPQLKRLTLRRISGVADAGLDAVAALPELEVLGLIEMDISGRDLARFQRRGRLRSLDLRDCEGLAADDYRALSAMGQLKDVKIAGPALTDSTLEIVAALPSLHSLLVADSSIPDDAIKRLGKDREFVDRIRSLAFTRCHGANDEALSFVTAMPRLETLSIRECTISGAFFMRWAETPAEELPRLRTLVVRGAFLSERAIAVLPRFVSSLKRLDLSEVMLSPGAMKSIGKLSELQSLCLSSCSLTDEAIEPIKNLKNLTTLDLSSNYDLTDESAAILKALPRLKHVNTDNTGMTLPDRRAQAAPSW